MPNGFAAVFQRFVFYERAFSTASISILGTRQNWGKGRRRIELRSKRVGEVLSGICHEGSGTWDIENMCRIFVFRFLKNRRPVGCRKTVRIRS
jgi:hypothetical protein